MFKNLEYHYSQDKWKEHAKKKDWDSGSHRCKIKYVWPVSIHDLNWLICCSPRTKINDKVASTGESVRETTMILWMSMVNDNNCTISRSVTPADIANLVNNMDHWLK